MNHFFLVTFKIFSMTFIISLTFRTFTMMHRFGNLIILILLEVYWVSWMCRLLVFNLGSVPILFIWTFFSTIFSLSSHYSYVGTLDGVPHFSETLFDFLHSLSVLSSACIISIKLSSSLLVLSSSSWNTLSPSSELLISVIVLFNSRISFWFFFLSRMDILYLI